MRRHSDTSPLPGKIVAPIPACPRMAHKIATVRRVVAEIAFPAPPMSKRDTVRQRDIAQ